MTISPWLTREEAADYLRVHERTLIRYQQDGQVTAHKLAGTQSVRYHRDDLDAMLKPLPAVADDETCCVPDAVPAGAHIDPAPIEFRCADPGCKCNQP